MTMHWDGLVWYNISDVQRHCTNSPHDIDSQRQHIITPKLTYEQPKRTYRSDSILQSSPEWFLQSRKL